MHFGDLHRRLVEVARERVRSGQISERRLARLSGLSQPHLHNVLKQIKALSPEAADRLLRVLSITVPELIWGSSAELGAEVTAVAILRSRIGPGAAADITATSGFYPLPSSLLSGLVDPVAARLAPDLVLPATLAAADLALLDQNPAIRRVPDGASCWVVRMEGGWRVRYLRYIGTSVYVADQSTLHDPQRWQLLPGNAGNILDTVRARIVWTSRKMETDPAGPPGSAGQSD